MPISQDDYPQKIFESINATGAKLTASDLIRNFMLMPIMSDKQEEYYAKYWKRLEDLLTNDSKKLEAFFRLYDSDDDKESTAAQVANPWHTAAYNREREKLSTISLLNGLIKQKELSGLREFSKIL